MNSKEKAGLVVLFIFSGLVILGGVALVGFLVGGFVYGLWLQTDNPMQFLLGILGTLLFVGVLFTVMVILGPLGKRSRGGGDAGGFGGDGGG
ncbi:MAG: hypothetical protein F4X65_07825 [Chloroflexi bacterium]|nr:hypothetical protein [Chloroflexota bacterium]